MAVAPRLSDDTFLDAVQDFRNKASSLRISLSKPVSLNAVKRSYPDVQVSRARIPARR